MPSTPDVSGSSSFVIARTKLLVPALRSPSRTVPRPQLLKLLDAGRSAKLTMVSAPTGWGKTSLLAEWATASDERFVWVSLDPSDDAPLRFWRAVVTALAAVEPSSAATALRRLQAPVVSIVDEILPVLINDLADAGGPLVVVLDDYHLISDRQVHTQLEYLLSRLPLGVHVAMATHVDPPLRLGRLRVIGELAELRPEQLRFTDDEAAQLLNRVHGLDLRPDEVETIQRRVEGWVAGLNLAALSLKREDGRGRLLEKLPADDRFLVDYLWDEVVLSQPRRVRRFLMHTAILERLTGDVCDAVTGGGDGAEMLRELERANLFVVPLDGERAWFRYHHLFRSLLLGQLERHAPELIGDLHRRASTWYADRGFTIDAIEHAIAAGDVHYAADELERHLLELYGAGQTLTLLSWMDRLPREAIAAHPALALVRAGLARVVGRVDEIEDWLQTAEEGAPETPAPGLASSIAGGAALVRSLHQLAVGDVRGGVAWAQRGFDLEPVDGSRERATAGYFLGVALFYEDPDRAEPLLRGFVDDVPDDERDPRHRYAMALLAETHALNDELEAAARMAHEARELTRRLGLEEHAPSNQVHVALGVVAFARGDLDAAEEHLERAVALARRGGDRVEVAHTLLWLGRVRARQHDAGGGRDALEVARGLLPDLGHASMRSLVKALEADLADATPAVTPVREGDALTDAELRVLRLMPGDLTYREMAAELYLSLNTVRTHAMRVRRKLGVSSRSGAVTRARERGLL